MFEADQEGDRFATIDDAVVVGHGQVHHRAHRDFTVDDHRALLDGVHAQHAGLRRVDDRGGKQRAKDTTVGDGERAAGEFVHRQLVIPGLDREHTDLLFDVGKAHGFGIAQDRHHQATATADGHTNVAVILVDDLLVTDFSVECGILLQGIDRSLDEEAHEAELHTVTLLEAFFVLTPQRHHRGHVDLVESRQQSRRLLGLNEAPRDGPPQRGHGLDLFVTRPVAHAGIDADACGRGSRRGLSAARTTLAAAIQEALHIGLENAPARAGAIDGARVEFVFVDQTLRGRHDA